jgi:hypothetical protein
MVIFWMNKIKIVKNVIISVFSVWITIVVSLVQKTEFLNR